MNNQEAITLLRNLEDSLDSYCELNEEGKTAFRMAIEALNCSEIPNNSDTISRQAAIDALKTDMASLDHIIKGMSAYDVRLDAYVSQRNQVNCDIDTISNLPSAQPERKTGRWIPSDSELEIKCNKCGKDFSEYVYSTDYIFLAEYPKFCQNCGADMRSEQNE